MRPKIVAIVPAKSSSERVKNKNTRPFNGEPLYIYTVRKLLSCDFIDEVYVDSDCPKILKRASEVGAKSMLRDPALATNATDGHQLFLNEVENINADIYIQHLCTSPFVDPATIKKAVDILLHDLETDTVVLGRSEKYYWWRDGQPAYNLAKIPNSGELAPEVSEAMALYVIRKEAAVKTRRRIGEKVRMVMGSPLELIDVNTEEDLALANAVIAGKAAQERRVYRVLCNIVSTPVISDICDEFKIESFVQQTLTPNFPSARILGRARTLHLRPAVESDAPDAIYHALSSYSWVFENDIVVVQNDCPHLAYFGELNMNLSIRAGAVGAIIGGMTRDSWATVSASFPVFAQGFCAKDIKGMGAVGSINETINLFGRKVQPSDVILADREGVFILPYWKSEAILRRAVEVVAKEKNILTDIAAGQTVEAILERHGFF